MTTNDIDSVRMAERFGAAAQVMLAAIARDDLCLMQTKINVRVENNRKSRPLDAVRIEPLPSNDGREWVVRPSHAMVSDKDHFEEISIELFTMVTIILREASLLPEADFSTSLERAFKSGLGHKLSPGLPYDQLAAAFGIDSEPKIKRSEYNTPWDCRDGSFGAHDELRWQDGPGPTYSRDKANEILRTRYVNLAQSTRITSVMLASSEEFRPTVETLRTKGWLDWHILTAIVNIVMNYRFRDDRFNRLSEDTQREIMRAALRSESAFAEPVPIGLFTPESMNQNRQFAMLHLLGHWGLERHQVTPDMPGIELLLADRYGYWDEDASMTTRSRVLS